MCLYMGETYMIIHVQHIRHVMLRYVMWACVCAYAHESAYVYVSTTERHDCVRAYMHV